MKTAYENIIGMPHHTSKKRKQMSIADRAAQFSSFQALSGFGDDITEKGRLTERKAELNDEEIRKINGMAAFLTAFADEQPAVKITHFTADLKKDGGSYTVTEGNFKRIDEFERLIVLTNGARISIDDVFDISLEK